MSDNRVQNVTLEDVRVIFRNFSGEEKQYNNKGKRNFCVTLTKEQADVLVSQGWNVKVLDPRDPEDEPQPYIQVSVQYGKYPPKIVMITDGGQTLLTEETVNALDFVEFEHVDLIIRPYEWEPGRLKAYAKTMYARIHEDELERKYHDPNGSVDFEEDEVPF